MDGSDQLETLLQSYNDGELTVNGRTYELLKTNFQEMLMLVQGIGLLQYFETPGDDDVTSKPLYKKCENIVMKNIMYNGMQLCKLPDHFNEYPEDYLLLITNGWMALCSKMLQSEKKSTV